MKRFETCAVLAIIAAISLPLTGCGMESVLSDLGFRDLNADLPTGLAAQVASKAEAIGERIGGADGFGGNAVDGYGSHMDDHMGFHGTDDLADADGRLTIVLHNESGEDATFDVVFMASHMGIEEQIQEINVPAGDEVTFELPCSEIVGLGSLTVVGETAVELSDATEFDNTMCVPAFLGSDFLCDGAYHCFLAADTDDVDADGDTEELIVTTEALESHSGPNGMSDHGNMMTGMR